jgi:thioredoxin-related protein
MKIIKTQAFIYALMLVLPLGLTAQENSDAGIHFEALPNWEAVKAKAKAENKYIFLDCYATWCGPCKQMEQEVYTVDSVGKYFNDHFISVKVQMDSTGKDDAKTKGWYADAHYLQHAYHVGAFPSFLFFNPDGKAVHKALGFLAAPNLLNSGHNALDPDKQFYTRLERARQGTLPYEELPDLINDARNRQYVKASDTIAKSYINNYLLKNDNVQLSPGNIGFIGAYLQNVARPSREQAFKPLYELAKNAHNIDTGIYMENYARSVVDIIMTKEEIDTYLYKPGRKPQEALTDHPDWKIIRDRITKKYNAEDAYRLVSMAKINWFYFKKDYPNYCKAFIYKFEHDGAFETTHIYHNYDGILNSAAWTIFQFSHNPKQLEAALSWADKANKIAPYADAGMMDTYANLLYKLGKSSEAIAYEEKALSIATDGLIAALSENLTKMKAGKPTW